MFYSVSHSNTSVKRIEFEENDHGLMMSLARNGAWMYEESMEPCFVTNRPLPTEAEPITNFALDLRVPSKKSSLRFGSLQTKPLSSLSATCLSRETIVNDMKTCKDTAKDLTTYPTAVESLGYNAWDAGKALNLVIDKTFINPPLNVSSVCEQSKDYSECEIFPVETQLVLTEAGCNTATVFSPPAPYRILEMAESVSSKWSSPFQPFALWESEELVRNKLPQMIKQEFRECSSSVRNNKNVYKKRNFSLPFLSKKPAEVDSLEHTSKDTSSSWELACKGTSSTSQLASKEQYHECLPEYFQLSKDAKAELTSSRGFPSKRPIKCDICDKIVRADNMKVHLRNHTGEKPYSCQFCFFRSANPSSLPKHLRLHRAGRTVHTCDHCNYSTLFKSNLIVHVRCCHKELFSITKPRCALCRATFPAKSLLASHIASCHHNGHTDLMMNSKRD